MDHSQDIKAVAKELRFPGGKGLQKVCSEKHDLNELKTSSNAKG